MTCASARPAHEVELTKDCSASPALACLRAITAPSVLVFDPLGQVFGVLRALDLPRALRRVGDLERVTALEMTTGVYASYGAVDWESADVLARQVPTLVVTTTYSREEALLALRRGLIGYLDAALPRDALDRALTGALLHGEPGFARDILGEWLRARHGEPRREPMAKLTGRQQQIVQLIAVGATDKEIAARLGIAQTTAQKHVSNLLKRLGVPNRAAAVSATQHGRALAPGNRGSAAHFPREEERLVS